LIGNSEVHFFRYTLPLIVVLGFGMGCFVERMGALRWGKLGVAIAILALGGVLDGAGLRSAAQYTMWMSGEDPRDEGARFLFSELLKDQGYTLGLWSPILGSTPLRCFRCRPRRDPIFSSGWATCF
jgi:hypothetical protein